MGYDPSLESTIHAQSVGRPFAKCPGCKINAIPQSAKYCNECKRLYALGMKVPPQEAADTMEVQSNPASDHSGFSTTAPQAKVNSKKERV